MNRFELIPQPIEDKDALSVNSTVEHPVATESLTQEKHTEASHEHTEAQGDLVEHKESKESTPSVTRTIAELNNPYISQEYEGMLLTWHDTHEKNKALEQEVASLKNRNEVLEEEVQYVNERISGFEAMIQERNDTIRQLEVLIDTLTTQIDTYEAVLNHTRETISFLQDKNNQLSVEVRSLTFDSLTNLKNRFAFYKQINTSIQEELPNILPEFAHDIENCSYEDLVKGFTTLNPESLSSVPLTILNGDGSGVSIANSSSHSKGDELISLYGEASKRTMRKYPDTFEIYRYGGDEFMGIMFEHKPDALNTMKQEFLKNINAQEFPYFSTHGIDTHLNMDIETSHFQEGVNAFIELMKSIEKHNSSHPESDHKVVIPQGRRLRTFMDLWMSIADEKAIIRKAENRIAKLQEYKAKHPPIHKNIIDLLRKGALHISDETLQSLPQEEDLIRFYVLEMRKRNLEKKGADIDTQTLLEQLSADIVQKHVVDEELKLFEKSFYEDITIEYANSTGDDVLTAA